MKLPLFPLPICLLPEGYTELRIFEPRYKRLVAESLKSGTGFGLCMTSQTCNNILPIGTLVHIIDFKTLADGFLGISIVGHKRVRLGFIEVEADGLIRSDVTLIDNWPSAPIQDAERYLSQMLQNILKQYPKHLRHCHAAQFNDISWVCQRWLEILPIAAEDKFTGINAQDHRETLKLLHSALK